MSQITADEFQWSKLPRFLFKALSSYWLATAVLVFMTIVTLFGTLYQVDHGLFAAKQRFFHSWIITYKLGGNLPIPILPGGLLLMTLLTLNLVIGAILKVKKRARGIGMLIAHFGMIFLLVSGFVTFAFNREGYMALYEGQTGARVESYRKWQIEILPLDDKGEASKALTIPYHDIETIDEGEQRVFLSNDLPFDVVLSGYVKNAIPMPVGAPMAAQATGREIDGYKLLVQPPSKEAEQNQPAVIATFRPKEGGGEPVETFLSARSANFDPREGAMAFGFEIGGKRYAARMVKENWPVPFTVRLDKFIFERHPGVSMARNYESRVSRIENGEERPLEIKMNQPMRYGGFTFFQESFGPANARPGDAMYSQFAVHNNPA
ncbi:MAG: cytochrome c biogenesis protein ResB, partial [Verrucomicrobiae bacterium]|nr:cytochrome c biogenesis protein ResB [Verrucomicrobiae bacterium]